MADILVGATVEELLSEEALDRADIEARIERAEVRVIGRYREKEARSDRDSFRSGLAPRGAPGTVRLHQWSESDGTPDIEEMPDDLVRRLQLVIAKVVMWRLEQEQTEHFESESVGSKSVSYADTEDLPTRLFQPLDKYDARHPIDGFW